MNSPTKHNADGRDFYKYGGDKKKVKIHQITFPNKYVGIKSAMMRGYFVHTKIFLLAMATYGFGQNTHQACTEM